MLDWTLKDAESYAGHRFFDRVVLALQIQSQSECWAVRASLEAEGGTTLLSKWLDQLKQLNKTGHNSDSVKSLCGRILSLISLMNNCKNTKHLLMHEEFQRKFLGFVFSPILFNDSAFSSDFSFLGVLLLQTQVSSNETTLNQSLYEKFSPNLIPMNYWFDPETSDFAKVLIATSFAWDRDLLNNKTKRQVLVLEREILWRVRDSLFSSLNFQNKYSYTHKMRTAFMGLKTRMIPGFLLQKFFNIFLIPLQNRENLCDELSFRYFSLGFDVFLGASTIRYMSRYESFCITSLRALKILINTCDFYWNFLPYGFQDSKIQLRHVN